MGWWFVCRRAKCLLEHEEKCLDAGVWLYFSSYMPTWPIARCDLCKHLSWRPFEVMGGIGRKFSKPRKR
jgi:hypothetical protein